MCSFGVLGLSFEAQAAPTAARRAKFWASGGGWSWAGGSGAGRRSGEGPGKGVCDGWSTNRTTHHSSTTEASIVHTTFGVQYTQKTVDRKTLLHQIPSRVRKTGTEKPGGVQKNPFGEGPHPSGPHPSGPPPLWPPTFRGSLAAPTLRGPRIQAPTLRAEALRASTFSVFGPPYVPHFIIFLICSFFCALFFVSISCHFFLNLSLFLFILIFFHIFQSLCFFFSKKNYFLSFLSFFFKLGGGKPKPVTSF